MFRLARTIVLGAVAAALGIWFIGRAWDVENSRLLGFLVTSAWLVAGCIALAGAAGGGLAWLRARRAKRRLALGRVKTS